MPCVYILRSKRNGKYYIGSTIHIEDRLGEHNRGKVTATRYLAPLELAITVPCDNILAARKAEYRLKKYKRRDIIEHVVRSGRFPWDYRD